MASPAAVLTIQVNANTRSASSSLSRMDQSAQKSAGHLSNLDKTSGRLSGTLSRVGRAALAAGAGYVSLQAAKTAVNNTEDLAKATLSLNQNLGFTQKTAVELATTLKVRGADAKQTSQAFATFAGVLNQAKEGSASATQKFNQLGIGGKRLQGDLKNPQKALMDVADGLKNVGSGVVRTDSQRKLFGRGWQSLSPILRDGSKALKSNLDEAKPVFDAFGGDGVNSIKDLIKAQRDMQIQMLALEVSFTKNLAPALISIMGFIGKLIGFFRDLFHATNQMGPSIGELVKWVVNAAKNFAHWISTTGTLAEYFHTLIGIVVQLAKVFFDVGKAAVTGAKWIFNAFKNVVDFFHGATWGGIQDVLTAPFRLAFNVIKGIAGDIIGAVQGIIGFFKKANWGEVTRVLTAPFRDAVGLIQGFIHDIVNVINTVLGPIGVHIGGGGGGGAAGANKISGSVGTSKAQGKGPGPHRGVQKGGWMVPGSGTGDVVPAMLEPGEFVLNRKAVAAAGVGNLDRYNKSVPRFARGGLSSTNPSGRGATGHPTSKTAAAGGFNLPGVGSLPGWIQPAGQFVLDKVGGFIKSKLASIVPGVGGDILNTKSGASTLASLKKSHPELQPGITQVLAAVLANNGGLSITSTTGGSHVPGSYHYMGRAVDIAGSSGSMSSASNWIKRSGLYKMLTEGIHNPNLAVQSGHIYSGAGPFGAVWADHLNHIHLAKQKGGIIGKFAQAVMDTHAPKNAAVALFEAGYAESGMRDLAGGDSTSEGVLQLLASTASSMGLNPHDPYGVAKAFLTRGYYKYGSAIGMANLPPAQIATRTQGNATGAGVYSAQHSAAISAMRGAGLKWDKNGRPIIAGASRSKTRAPKGKKVKKGTKNASGSNAFDDALQAFHDANDPRIASMNELLAGGNMEALQRYQTGVAQNPLLGIAKPGVPALSSMRSTDPTLDDILGIDKQIYPNHLGAGPYLTYPGGRPGVASSGFGHAKAGAYDIHHHHVYIDGKELRKGVKSETKRESRRGHRPLPSSRRS